MIKLFLNGYFKSGSTRMWWIIKRSNPEFLHIYEPLHPEWLELKDQTFSSLHELPVWEDYHRPEFKCIEREWVKKWRELRLKYESEVIPREIGEVSPLFDLVHELSIPVVIQPNRCHLILDALTKRYKCKFIHIIRNPIDTWIAHTIEPVYPILTFSKKIKKLFKRILFSTRTNKFGRYFLLQKIPKRDSTGNSYSLESVYKLANKYFGGCVECADHLDKLLVVWALFNYEAWKQSGDCGLIIYYEEIVVNPNYWFKIIENFGNIKLDTRYAKELSPKFITVSDELREEFVKRLDRLGLLDIVEKFYPPERWFMV